MKALILCGGLGTRIREETEFRPKPMLEIGGKPILWHIMKIYAHHGVTDFVLCVGYKGHMIKEYFLNYRPMNSDFTIRLGDGDRIAFHETCTEFDWSVTLVDTGAGTNTGGRVKLAERFLDDDIFLVTYGDGLADIDVRALLAFHRSHGRIATMTTVQPTTRFGLVDLDDGGHIERFREKPQSDGWVNGGFFVFNREVFEYLETDSVLEREPLERLAKDGQLMAFRHAGFWQPMDTFREFTFLNGLWAEGEAPWKVWAA